MNVRRNPNKSPVHPQISIGEFARSLDMDHDFSVLYCPTCSMPSRCPVLRETLKGDDYDCDILTMRVPFRNLCHPFVKLPCFIHTYMNHVANSLGAAAPQCETRWPEDRLLPSFTVLMGPTDVPAMGSEERRKEPRTDEWLVDTFRIQDTRFQNAPSIVPSPRCDTQTMDQRRERFFADNILLDIGTVSIIERHHREGAHRRQEFGLGSDNSDFQESDTTLFNAVQIFGDNGRVFAYNIQDHETPRPTNSTISCWHAHQAMETSADEHTASSASAVALRRSVPFLYR